MALTTVAQVRSLAELSEDDISNADLSVLIDEIGPTFWKDVSARIEWERPDGQIDDVNLEYRVKHSPICPTQNSTDIVLSDIEVYGIKRNSDTGFDESSVLTVSEIKENDGRLILAIAPQRDDVDEIRVNYAYRHRWIDWTRVSTAVAYLVASKAFDKSPTSGEQETVKFKDLSITEKNGGSDSKTQSQQMLANYQNALKSVRGQNWMASKSRSERRSAITLRQAKMRRCV
jgi:hypothetical protein